jgi:hypothetical protein
VSDNDHREIGRSIVGAMVVQFGAALTAAVVDAEKAVEQASATAIGAAAEESADHGRED